MIESFPTPKRLRFQEVAEAIVAVRPDAVVRRISDQHGDRIEVESEDGLVKDERRQVASLVQNHAPEKTDEDERVEQVARHAEVSPEKLVATLEDLNRRIKALEEKDNASAKMDRKI